MVVAGLLLIAVAVAAGTLLATHAQDGSGAVVSVNGHAAVLGTTTLLVIGAVLGVLLALGFLVLEAGARRHSAQRRRLRAARREAAAAARERDELAARLGRERPARPAGAAETAVEPSSGPRFRWRASRA